MASGLAHRTKMCTWRTVMSTVTRLSLPAVSLAEIPVAKHNWLSLAQALWSVGLVLVLTLGQLSDTVLIICGYFCLNKL